MLIQNKDHIFKINNNPTVIKGFKLPLENSNIQSRNYKNALINENNLRKYSLYSTKDATPRKEYNKFIIPHNTKNNTFYKPNKEKSDKNELDDSLSQISQILNNNRDLNYSGLVEKIPGINEEPNFVYDQILFNKSSINKAKILSDKIGVLKLPISNISSKEALTNSGRGKKCFSDRVQKLDNMNKKNKIINDDNNADITCCFFGKNKNF